MHSTYGRRAGCLPTIATIPIFWGLFRTLSNVTNEGRLTEGFYWLPSLAGPASLADRSSGEPDETRICAVTLGFIAAWQASCTAVGVRMHLAG